MMYVFYGAYCPEKIAAQCLRWRQELLTAMLDEPMAARVCANDLDLSDLQPEETQ